MAIKKITYNGDSKVIKRLCEVLNDLIDQGSGDSVSWTQIQASGTKIAEIDINGTSTDVYAPNGGGGGGHTIWNRIKTALTARSNLWFADAKISDASADDATKVEVLTELADETAFDNLPTDGTADGMYAFPDSGAEYLDASMVGYGNGTVDDALDELTESDTADVTTGAGTSIAIHLIKKGKLVYLWIESGSFTANANNTIVQLPSGFFPVLICDVRDTYSNKRLNINTDGTIVCKESISGTILRGTFTYMCS